VAKIYQLFILILHAKKTPQMKSEKLSKVLLLSQTIKEITDIKLSLSIPLQHTGDQRHRHHSFLTSALDGNEWPTSRPDRFTPEKETQYPLNKRLGGLQNR
jgi:hypothetical protein